MRRFAGIGVLAIPILILTLCYPPLLLGSARGSDVRKSEAKPSSRLEQLYRTIEMARRLHPQQRQHKIAPATAVFKTTDAQAIAGKVDVSDGTPLNLLKIIVIAYTADSSSTPSKGFAYMNSDGSYLIEHLLPGNFYVFAQVDNYETQYYHLASTLDQAQIVSVAAADTTENINFNLTKITPGTGVISGKITNSSAAPIANANVAAFSKNNPGIFVNAVTANDGTYRLAALKNGGYIVQAWGDGYIAEFYNNRRVSENPDFVNVVEPLETPNIDFVLNAGGSLTGKVTDKSGAPIGAAMVQGYFTKTDSSPYKSFGMALTEKDGTYKISGLEAGAYVVSAEAWTPWSYAKEWYKHASTPDAATLVNVQEEQTISGIDFTLDLPRIAGSLSGTVTNQKDEPIFEASIQAYSWIDSLSLKPQFWIYSTTDAQGNYRLEAPAGKYVVSASAYNGWQSVTQWYPNVSTPDSAKLLSVQQNGDLQNIDFSLPIINGNSVIYGKVFAEDGRPLAGAFIEVTPADDLTKPIWKVWANGVTDSLGNYYVPQLPPGKYLVHAQHWEDIRFGEQWHKNAESRDQALPVEVKDSEKIGSIDFSLKLRPRYGSVFGRVTADADGAPIERAYVEVLPVKRDYYNGAPIKGWNWHGITNERGDYRLEGLPEGEYLISVYANGAFEYFENASVPEQATRISIIGGDSTKVHFGLTPRNEGKGAITGIVAAEANGPTPPIAIIVARPTIVPLVWPKSEMFFTAISNVDGSYKITGLPEGEYFVMSFAPKHSGEYYANVFDAAEAKPVKVSGQAPAEKIDFSLQPIYYRNKEGLNSRAGTGASVFGKVRDITKKGVGNAYVYVLNDNRQPVAFARTNVEGGYEINDVLVGQYRLFASHIAYSSKYNDEAINFNSAKPVDIGLGKSEINFVLDPKTTTGVDDQTNVKIPQTVELYGNYPNPFNPETQIAFGLPATLRVKIRIFNLLGEEIASLYDGVLHAGAHRLTWNGRNKFNREVGSGLYLYRLESGAVTLRGKMLLMR